LTLGFDAPVPSALYEQKEVSRQGRTLAFVERQLGATDLQMERVGNRAILKGRVPSEERARLAERIARLEPGIQEVDNQLEIETAVPIEKN
jgi:osmotically-inducible protein OsmY